MKEYVFKNKVETSKLIMAFISMLLVMCVGTAVAYLGFSVAHERYTMGNLVDKLTFFWFVAGIALFVVGAVLDFKVVIDFLNSYSTSKKKVNLALVNTGTYVNKLKIDGDDITVEYCLCTPEGRMLGNKSVKTFKVGDIAYLSVYGKKVSINVDRVFEDGSRGVGHDVYSLMEGYYNGFVLGYFVEELQAKGIKVVDFSNPDNITDSTSDGVVDSWKEIIEEGREERVSEDYREVTEEVTEGKEEKVEQVVSEEVAVEENTESAEEKVEATSEVTESKEVEVEEKQVPKDSAESTANTGNKPKNRNRRRPRNNKPKEQNKPTE